MTITQEKIEEFKSLYKKNFGIEINNKEAIKLITPLLLLIKCTLFPNRIETLCIKK